MKANEFANGKKAASFEKKLLDLLEAQMHDYHHQAIPGAKTFPGMGQSYQMYRFSVAMAGAPHYEHEVGNGTDATDNPATISYSHGDEAIINAALKKLGQEGIQVSGKGSEEPKDTHKVSPVKGFSGFNRGARKSETNTSDKGVY
jgi:hypothetical protein